MPKLNIEAYPTEQAAKLALASMDQVEVLFFGRCKAAMWSNGIDGSGDTASLPGNKGIWVIVAVQK